MASYNSEHFLKRNILTDESLHENEEHGTNEFPFSYYAENMEQFYSYCIDWHWHREVEFLTVKNGSIICSTNKKDIVLPENTSIFINSSILHKFTSDSPADIPNIVFAPWFIAPKESLIYEKYVYPILSRGSSYIIFSPEIEWQNDVNKILQEIYNECESEEQDEISVFRDVINLWDILLKHIELTPEIENKEKAINQARLQSMMKYIQEHYREKITLEDIARAGLVSKSSALSIFNTEIKESPVAYMIRYRLMKAAEMLEKTDKDITLIAEENGFSSSGYFCRMFNRLFHCSPGKYRKNHIVS